jgi:hypothetical protein
MCRRSWACRLLTFFGLVGYLIAFVNSHPFDLVLRSALREARSSDTRPGRHRSRPLTMGSETLSCGPTERMGPRSNYQRRLFSFLSELLGNSCCALREGSRHASPGSSGMPG